MDSASVYQAGQTSSIQTSLPLLPGAHNVLIRAWNSNGEYGSGTLSVNVAAPAPAPIAISTPSIPGGTVSSAYSATLTAGGGTSPYTWSVTSGQLPAGLSLSTSGNLSGTPTTAGQFTFGVQVKDSASTAQTASASYTVNIASPPPAPLSVSVNSLPGATVGTAYSTTLRASGGTVPYTWTQVGGQLPAGLALASSGVISGTPSTAGQYSFTVQVKDSATSPQAAQSSFIVTVADNSASATCANICYYVSPTGSDTNVGTNPSAPWKTIAKVQSFQANLQPGDSVLLQRGGVWYEQLDIKKMNGSSALPITIGNYGTGNLPVIDGGYTSSTNGRNYCIDGLNTSYSYLVIDGIECRNAYAQGITFKAYSGGGNHVTVKSSYIHNTGRGACQTCTVTPGDPGGYVNQLDAQFVDYVTFSNNVLNHCGGHNCLQVHYDEGGSIVSGNKIGTTLSGANAPDNYCVHNCLDIKGGNNNQVLNNYVYCPNCTAGAAFYTENTGDRGDAAEYITWIGNVANQHGNGFEAEGGMTGGGTCNASPCAIHAKYYNNTVYLTGSPFATGSCGSGNGPYMYLDFQKNIFDGGSLYWPGGSCNVTWDYNDDGGVNAIKGNPTGPHDLKQVNPQYTNASGGNFAPQNSTILNYGANSPVTQYPYLGGVQ